MNESKINISKLDDNKMVVNEVEHRDGLVFMRMKVRKLK